MTGHKTSTPTSIIDGVSGDNNVVELWASKLKDLLNTNHNSLDEFSHFISGNIFVYFPFRFNCHSHGC